MFALRDWGELRETSLRIFGVPAAIRASPPEYKSEGLPAEQTCRISAVEIK
jgi:hypothetical protein